MQALVGCRGLLERDFKKATLVGEVRLGSVEVLKRTLALPPGEGRLILAVANYRCLPIKDATIVVSVRGSNELGFSERLSLSQFTWSYGKDSCDAIGYLQGITQNHERAGRGEMRINLSESETVTIEVDASDVRSATGRVAAIWFIYGDRIPTRRIFGTR